MWEEQVITGSSSIWELSGRLCLQKLPYQSIVSHLRCRVVPDDTLHALLVLSAILLEHVVCLGLGGRVGVGIVQKVLDAKQNLLDGDGGLPSLLLVQNRQADGATGVDVRVEQRGREFACRWVSRGCSGRSTGVSSRLTLRRLGRVLLRENQRQLVKTALPESLFLAGNTTLPFLEVEYAIGSALGLGKESERMIFAPELSV